MAPLDVLDRLRAMPAREISLMTATLEIFPVDNGDMTLLTFESGKKILIDVNIRKSADDEEEEDVVDVAQLLRDRLDRDAKGRYFVDAFLLSHPDQDHCRGLKTHFHLGRPADWSKKDDKILIREMWSSPIIFRRKKEAGGDLCDDAQAWWDEARRRVNLYKGTAKKNTIENGDLIQVLGEDRGGKTDGLTDILVKVGTEITKICGAVDDSFRAWLLGPQLVSEKDAETLSGKNHSSTIVRFGIKGGESENACRFLTGGDAEVENWQRVWTRNKNTKDRLQYDILLAPHHCSWHSLSFDSWSDKKEKANVDPDARSALSQSLDEAYVVASSVEIKDDDVDPPCIRAKREYEEIVNAVKGAFVCTAEECDDDVLLFEIGSDGPTKGKKRGSGGGGGTAAFSGGVTPGKVDKQGGRRYA